MNADIIHRECDLSSTSSAQHVLLLTAIAFCDLVLDKHRSMHQQPHWTAWTELSSISSLVYFQTKGKMHGSLTGLAIVVTVHVHSHGTGRGGMLDEKYCSGTNMKPCLLHIWFMVDVTQHIVSIPGQRAAIWISEPFPLLETSSSVWY